MSQFSLFINGLLGRHHRSFVGLGRASLSALFNFKAKVIFGLTSSSRTQPLKTRGKRKVGQRGHLPLTTDPPPVCTPGGWPDGLCHRPRGHRLASGGCLCGDGTRRGPDPGRRPLLSRSRGGQPRVTGEPEVRPARPGQWLPGPRVPSGWLRPLAPLPECQARGGSLPVCVCGGSEPGPEGGLGDHGWRWGRGAVPCHARALSWLSAAFCGSKKPSPSLRAMGMEAGSAGGWGGLAPAGHQLCHLRDWAP